MRDFCLRADSDAAILEALAYIGAADIGDDGTITPVGDYCYAGNGYAVLRVSDSTGMHIEVAASIWAGTVALVDPPDWVPRFGGLWLVPDIEALQDAACARIDARAEASRSTVLTPGSGQMATYQAKEAQARALLQEPEPTEANYPDIFNEVGITADTAHEVAMTVLAAAEKWRLYGRAVERARLAGKQAVRAAQTASAIATAEAGVAWPDLP